MGCHTGSFLLRLAPSPPVSWKGYEILLMGCGSFVGFALVGWLTGSPMWAGGFAGIWISAPITLSLFSKPY
jgi:hypothetical protein